MGQSSLISLFTRSEKESRKRQAYQLFLWQPFEKCFLQLECHLLSFKHTHQSGGGWGKVVLRAPCLGENKRWCGSRREREMGGRMGKVWVLKRRCVNGKVCPAAGGAGRDGEDTEGSGGGSKEDLQPAALALGLAGTEHLPPSSSRTCPGVARGGEGAGLWPQPVSQWLCRGSPAALVASPCAGSSAALIGFAAGKWVCRGGTYRLLFFLLLLLFIFLNQISPAALGKGRAPSSPSVGLWGVGPFPSPCPDSLELWLLNCAPSPSLNFLCWLWRCSDEPTPLPPAGRRLS